MLIFKKNIYETSESIHPENMDNQFFDPYNFVFHSLLTDREIFFGLNQLPKIEAGERVKTLFPHIICDKLKCKYSFETCPQNYFEIIPNAKN